jgi:preprotein translocase subunit SecY
MKGIGNGTSVIILTGIVSTLPSKIAATYDYLVGSQNGIAGMDGVGLFVVYIFLSLIVILVIS